MLRSFSPTDLFSGPVPEVIDELKDGQEVIAIWVAHPIAFGFNESFSKWVLCLSNNMNNNCYQDLTCTYATGKTCIILGAKWKCTSDLKLRSFAPTDLFSGPVPEVVDELKDGQEVVAVWVTFPIAFGFNECFLDSGDEGLVPFHDVLQLLLLLFPLFAGPLLHQRLQGLGQPTLRLWPLQVLAQRLQKHLNNSSVRQKTNFKPRSGLITKTLWGYSKLRSIDFGQ